MVTPNNRFTTEVFNYIKAPLAMSLRSLNQGLSSSVLHKITVQVQMLYYLESLRLAYSEAEDLLVSSITVSYIHISMYYKTSETRTVSEILF